jgi:putative hydrolase of the HAD superfamily
VIEIVFFDAGETLLHPHPSFPELFASTCNAHGYEVAEGEVARVQQQLAPHLTDIAEEELDQGLIQGASLSAVHSEAFWTALYLRLLRELGIDEPSLGRVLYGVFSSAASYALFDDVDTALDSLQDDGYKLGLISNFEDWLEEILDLLEVSHRFDTTIISGLAGIEKPDPGIYELALDTAGISADRAVHIGDSPVNDVEPAKAVGMQPILVDRLGRYPDPGCPTVASLTELPAVIGNLEGTGKRDG